MNGVDLLVYQLLKLSMLKVAGLARHLARNWRGFKVGAAVLARNPAATSAENMYDIFFGFNTKMDPNGSDRCCAEHHALKEARKAGYTIIIAIAVVAPVQADDESQRVHPTTHCCGTCRRMFADGALGVRPDTVIMTADADDIGIYEEHTFLEMCEVHGDGHLFGPVLN